MPETVPIPRAHTTDIIVKSITGYAVQEVALSMDKGV